MDKKIPHLPKDGLVEPEGRIKSFDALDDDTEGHGLPLTAPPSFLGSRQPGHGGENIPSPVDDDDAVEGHRAG